MGVTSSHQSKANGTTATGDIKQISTNGSSPARRHRRKRKDLPELNNNVSSKDYVYSTTNRRQWDSVLELTLEKSLCSDTESLAISPLTVNVWLETESRFHFKIFDANQRRFEVPVLSPTGDQSTPTQQLSTCKRKLQDTNYDVEYGEKPFSVRLTRRATGHILFDTGVSRMHFEDERLQISTAVHSKYMYGLGEHHKRFLIDTSLPHNFVFWAHDCPPTVGKNLYGSHPFFLALEEDGNAYGVYFHNSCALEVDVRPGDPAILSYTTNGGVLDFYIFTGPSPIEVVQQYQQVVGLPHLPPYWALGFHLCGWGYENVEELSKTIERTRQTGIPYEAQWTDIDLMDNNESWTYNNNHLSEIVKDLHSHGQRYVPNVNPSVSMESPVVGEYLDGTKSGVFIGNYSASRPLVGKVWAGECIFPDFSHPDVYKYWYSRAKSLFFSIPFDGLWLDMNEPANFVSGCQENCELTSSHIKDRTAFVPGNLSGGELYHKTVCPSARQYAGFHYQLHNLYGHMQMHVSHRVCKALRGKRCLIISRSTFSGSGRFGGHWSGDNNSTFSDLQFSISNMLDFNMFGIPLVGSDIGGFFGSCSEELMVRWMQVGAFYPFMRNHSCHPVKFNVMRQDPGQYSLQAQRLMKDIVYIRYSLLPFLYTLLHDNHTKGLPVIRPLYMMYPKDRRTYCIDEQFMWGSCLLISPCVHQGQTKVDAYFPFDIWYDFYTGQRLCKVGADLELPAPIDHVNVHIRGGSLLVTQTPDRNTTLSRRNAFGILAALDSAHTARGKLYWDDGETLDPIESKKYNLIKLTVDQNKLSTAVEWLGHREAVMKLRLVQIFGLYVQPDHVLVNGCLTPFSYNELQSVLQLDQINVDMKENLVIEW